MREIQERIHNIEYEKSRSTMSGGNSSSGSRFDLSGGNNNSGALTLSGRNSKVDDVSCETMMYDNLNVDNVAGGVDISQRSNCSTTICCSTMSGVDVSGRSGAAAGGGGAGHFVGADGMICIDGSARSGVSSYRRSTSSAEESYNNSSSSGACHGYPSNDSAEEESYYGEYSSELEEEEEGEDDEDTVGALLSCTSLSNKHRHGSSDEDEDTVEGLISSTSLANRHPLEEEEEEEEEEVGIRGASASVSSLNLCDSTSSFVSINSSDHNDYVTDNIIQDDQQGLSANDATSPRRKVRFDDDDIHCEHHQTPRQPLNCNTISSPTPLASSPRASSTTTDVNSIIFTSIDESMSRQLQDIKDRRERLLEHREKMIKRNSSDGGSGSVGSSNSACDNDSNGKSTVTTCSTSTTASSDHQGGLKKLLASPKRNRRVISHSTISEEEEYCGGIAASSSTPSTPKKKIMDATKNEQKQQRHLATPLERQGTHGSTATATSTSSTSSITSILEHAPLEVHLTGLQKRRSKLLELVEKQEEDNGNSSSSSDTTKKQKQRSIEFSLFLIKDKLNQLQDLGVLGEEDEDDDEILKSGNQLLRKIKSEGAPIDPPARSNKHRSRRSPFKRSSTATTVSESVSSQERGHRP